VAWILDKVPGARKRAADGELAFGTIDSWLVYKLTDGQVHATDTTNASRTLMYNIRTRSWDKDLLEILKVPAQILPEVRDSIADFGVTDEDLFGVSIPIRGIAGDQQAATVGQACLRQGLMKSTYGTGCFALVNTGHGIAASQSRLLSTIAYSFDGKTSYALEGSIFMAGATIQWLRDGLKLFPKAADVSDLALQANPNARVFLVPAFVGLGAPYWDAEARGAILGMTKQEIKRKFDEIVAFSGVEKYIDTPVKRYSSGMYVRLAFAVAAHLESEILIVDEVLAVGDAEFQKKCLGKMGDISKGDGRTVLFVSHNMAAVKALCSKGIFLENGTLAYSGDVNYVVNQYLNEIDVKSSWLS
jgi:sugar (pentulose or hexulose) kinase